MLKKTFPQKIVRSNGEIDSSLSTYCPKCSESMVSSEVQTGVQDFDENGWYNPVSMTCNNSKCKHQWTEKVCISQPSTKLW
jgi:major membrane immunogen (membrane-anchored lipoprotein)